MMSKLPCLATRVSGWRALGRGPGLDPAGIDHEVLALPFAEKEGGIFVLVCDGARVPAGQYDQGGSSRRKGEKRGKKEEEKKKKKKRPTRIRTTLARAGRAVAARRPSFGVRAPLVAERSDLVGQLGHPGVAA